MSKLGNNFVHIPYCGGEAYNKMKEYSGFDIKNWIETNVNWEGDFKAETMNYFKQNNLDQYLIW